MQASTTASEIVAGDVTTLAACPEFAMKDGVGQRSKASEMLYGDGYDEALLEAPKQASGLVEATAPRASAELAEATTSANTEDSHSEDLIPTLGSGSVNALSSDRLSQLFTEVKEEEESDDEIDELEEIYEVYGTLPSYPSETPFQDAPSPTSSVSSTARCSNSDTASTLATAASAPMAVSTKRRRHDESEGETPTGSAEDFVTQFSRQMFSPAHTPPGPCQWGACGAIVSTNAAAMAKHVRTAHGLPRKGPFPCRWGAEQCGNVAVTRAGLRRHLGADLHLGTLRGTCRLCGEEVARSDWVGRHLNTVCAVMHGGPEVRAARFAEVGIVLPGAEAREAKRRRLE